MGLEGRYTVVKKVADGGMAEIFLAHLTGAQGFARMVILKRILPVFSVDPHFRNMIVDEAHIAMSLHHGNIVQVLDLGEERGRYFLTMELVDGWDLATVISRGEAARLTLPTGLALYVVVQVCRALAYAHSQTRNGKPLGLVHRDISPQNVLVSEQGEVKLTDFGIAKALGKRERTQTGVIKGKLDFMSPEQAAGAVLDTRSDIFSLGTLLYLLSTGQRPFDADGQLETLIRVQNAEFAPPEVANPDISPRIAEIIKRAMRKAPSERYESAEEMMADVEEVLRSEFQSVGQSELKNYLVRLGQKDRVPPISQAPGLPQDDEEEAEETRPQGRTLAMGRADLRSGSGSGAPLLALDATLQRPTQPEAAGSLPAASQPDDSTDFVARPPRRRLGLGVPALVFVVLAAVAGTLYVLSPQTSRKLIDEGRERLARTLPTEKPPTPRPAREATAVPRAETSPRAPEPERRAPRPALVTLRLVSNPPKATVRNRSGAVVGQTPIALSLKPGTTQRLTFSKPGYASVTRTVTVPDGNDALSIELSRSAARRPHRR
jgi:serine/threonine-protein kinase